jgi:hypothetical protein
MMAKSVLETIREEYARGGGERERLLEADFEFDVADRLVEMRMNAGLTQEQLANKVGCSQAYVAKLENGGYDVGGLPMVRRFALALGYDINVDLMFVPLALSHAPEPAVWESCVKNTRAHLRVLNGGARAA